MSKLVADLATWAGKGKITRPQLMTIATAIGSPVSGPKARILTGIDNALRSSEGLIRQTKVGYGQEKELRVLSVDLGIRNLGYAFTTIRLGKQKRQDAKLLFGQPHLCEWHRTVVGTDTLADSQDDAETSVLTTILSPAATESFEPSTLASHAFAVVRSFAKLRPTHILIERQRFRSAGMAAVQEWTLRVGVFEGMLWAILHTLKQRGELECEIEAVLPARVNRFWLEQAEVLPESLREAVPVVSKKSSANAKQAKIGLVQRLLEIQGSSLCPIDFDEGVHPTIDLFRGGKRGKLDDLSDSLLQCLAWITWQKNRLNLLQDGDLELLLE